MEKLFEKYSLLLNQLKSNPAIELVKSVEKNLSFDDKTKSMFLKRMQSKLGYVLPNELLEFLDFSNGIHFYWTYNLGEKKVGGGEAKLNSLFEVFLFKQPQLWTEDMKPDKRELLKKFAFFDDHPLSGNGQLSGFIIDGSMPPPLFFYDRGETFKMNISYPEYLHEMLELAGISNWQYFFCEINDEKFRLYINENLTKKLNDLAILFPDKNLEKYYLAIKN